ncbi:MAG: molybdopterin-dependent oxidoreductase [Chloroflexota bacterium]
MTDVPGDRAPSLPARTPPVASSRPTADRPLLSPTAAAAIAGAVAAAVAIGTSELLAGFLPGAPSLVVAIGQTVIDFQPPGAKDIVVGLFGTNDKVALEIFIVAVAIALAAGLGIVARHRFWLAALGFIAAGVAAAAAAFRDPRNDAMLTFIAAAVAVAAGLQALSWLIAALTPRAGVAERGRAARRARAETAIDWSRRGFLGRAAALGVVAAGATVLGRTLVQGQRQSTAAAESLIPHPTAVASLPPGAALPVRGISPIVVPNGDFYRIDTALLVPNVDVTTWQLRIHGLVDRETTLTFKQLVELGTFEQYVTIACVSNLVGGDLVGNAKWTGVKLRDVLAIAGVRPEATQLVGRSVDGWTSGMPTSWVMDTAREPMIAVEMNDEPLPAVHGFPARLIVPGLYGYVSATKWLKELELTTLEAFDAYWVPLGWSKQAPILTQSRIDVPGGSVLPGTVPIAGVAWAPDRGVSRVEVAIDGAWRDATLSSPISKATWVQWRTEWAATPGDHVLMVRATDGRGQVQTSEESPPAPNGARGYHTVSVHVG